MVEGKFEALDFFEIFTHLLQTAPRAITGDCILHNYSQITFHIDAVDFMTPYFLSILVSGRILTH